MNRISRFVNLPVLAQLREYRPAWLKSDVAAGLSVAAVSLPCAVAYPAIAGLPTEVGIYAAIFALVGYALLGRSRQLMVGPDTAVCIMLASVLTALGATDQPQRVASTVELSIIVGLFCFVAGFLRLGFIANFLSRPMLVGFLAGISISLINGQIKRLTGVPVQSEGLFRPAIDLLRHLSDVHVPTLVLGLGSFGLLRLLRHVAPAAPGPLVAVILGIAISAAFDLQSHGVAVVGALPEIGFTPRLPGVADLGDPQLWGGALAMTVVGFGSGIVAARSFARKAHRETDANGELFGFGAANLASGLFGGFPVTAADSRTAVNFAIGGKTQLTGLIAAATIAAAMMFIAHVLAILPAATLGAVLFSAAIDLIDVKELRTLYRISRGEFAFAIVTMLGVVVVGVLQGVFIAIAATLGHMIWAASRPRLAMLGKIPGAPGLYKLHRYPAANAIPGLTIVTLESALVFFNADFVKQRLFKIAGAVRADGKWFILNAAAVNELDSTGVEVLEELRANLAARGMTFGLADLNARVRKVVRQSGLENRVGKDLIFSSAEHATAIYLGLPDRPADPKRRREPEREPLAVPAQI
jgi:SulP family sulfate permease